MCVGSKKHSVELKSPERGKNAFEAQYPSENQEDKEFQGWRWLNVWACKECQI